MSTFCFGRFSRVTLHHILSMNTPATSTVSAAHFDVTTTTAPPTVQFWFIYVLLDLFFPVVSFEFCHPKGGFSRSVCFQFLGVRELSRKISSVVYRLYPWSGVFFLGSHLICLITKPFVPFMVALGLAHTVNSLADLFIRTFLTFDVVSCFVFGFLICNEGWFLCIAIIMTSNFSGLNVL